MSFHFTDQLRRDMIVRDVRNRYPETQEVFERFDVRTTCWDCSLSEVAYRSGISIKELLDTLNAAIASRQRAQEEEPG